MDAEPYERPEVRDLLVPGIDPGAGVVWKPFRPGVQIHRLYGNGVVGPSAALLRYEAGAAVGWHEHDGYEHILILRGAQRDQNGPARAGTLVVNPPGTRHAVASEEGCVVLAIYEKPVRFLEVPAS